MGDSNFNPIHQTADNHLFGIDYGVQPGLQAPLVGPALAAAPTDTLQIATPARVQDGETSKVTVTAIGPDGKADPNFVGTVHLASSDGSAQIDPTYTFTPADGGSHTFGLSLFTPGDQTVAAMIDGAPSSQVTSDLIQILPGQAAEFEIDAPASVTPGQDSSLRIHTIDQYGNLDPNYWGSASISISLDLNGVPVSPVNLPPGYLAWLIAGTGLPPAYHFALTDHGVRDFPIYASELDAADLATIPGMSGTDPGQLSLVLDVTDPKGVINPTSVTIPIQVPPESATPPPTPAPTASDIGVLFHGPTAAVAGLPTTLSLETFIRPGSPSRGSHTIHFTSSDTAASLPTDLTFDPGTNPFHDLTATLATPGVQVIYAIDTSDSQVVGATSVEVQAPALTPQAQTVDLIYESLLNRPADTHWQAAPVQSPARVARRVMHMPSMRDFRLSMPTSASSDGNRRRRS